MDRSTLAKLAKVTDLSEAEQTVLIVASAHVYKCTCNVCREWWKIMGPDSFSIRSYGPFEISDIEDESERGKQCKFLRLRYQDEEKDDSTGGDAQNSR